MAECSSKSTCSKSSCEGCPSAAKENQGQKGNEEDSFICRPHPMSSVKHVIGVVSGKGGVGKSFVTGSLANRMAEQGYKVGIMDADITGPSIPKMYGLNGAASASEDGIVPMTTANGIKVMSVNLLLPTEETPVIWRGPILGNMVRQFWADVIWGELDYLFVDMPPGTGDVPLTAFQSLPLDGVVIVTSPQDLVRMIVTKAYNMASMMNIPVLGIIENYSYLVCPDCGRPIMIFGKSHIEQIAAELGVPVLGQMPVDPAMAAASDAGDFASVHNTFIANVDSVLPR